MEQQREDEILRLYAMMNLVNAGIKTDASQISREMGNLAHDISRFSGKKFETHELVEVYGNLSQAKLALQQQNLEAKREERRQKART